MIDGQREDGKSLSTFQRRRVWEVFLSRADSAEEVFFRSFF